MRMVEQEKVKFVSSNNVSDIRYVELDADAELTMSQHIQWVIYTVSNKLK